MCSCAHTHVNLVRLACMGMNGMYSLGGQRSILGVFFKHVAHPFLFLWSRASQWTWSSLILFESLHGEHSGPLFLHCRSWRTGSGYYIWLLQSVIAGDQIQDPFSCLHSSKWGIFTSKIVYFCSWYADVIIIKGDVYF